MGTIIKRNGVRGPTFRVVIRRRIRQSKDGPVKSVVLTDTFKKATHAREWMRQREANLDGRQVFSKGHTVGSIINDYSEEVEKKKPYKGKNWHHYERFAQALREAELEQMTTEWWVDLVKSWGCSPQSRLKYLSMITGALKWGELLYELELDWSGYHRARKLLKTGSVVGKGRPRARRLKPGELEAIKAKLRSKLPIADIIDFALETGMRVGEILRITWADFDKLTKTVWVRDRKHKEKLGNDWNVRLSGLALDIVMRQPTKDGADGPIFPHKEDSVGSAFRRAVRACGVSDLTFHDLRHEGISLLFEKGYGIAEVALLSGHTDWESLRIYTNLNPASLHAGPAGRRPA